MLNVKIIHKNSDGEECPDQSEEGDGGEGDAVNEVLVAVARHRQSEKYIFLSKIFFLSALFFLSKVEPGQNSWGGSKCLR